MRPLSSISTFVDASATASRCIRLFDGNWLIKAFQEVTTGDKSPSVDLELSKTRQLLMPELHHPNRNGLTQLMQANANMLETLGHNNCWMHFQRVVGEGVDELRVQRESTSFVYQGSIFETPSSLSTYCVGTLYGPHVHVSCVTV